MKFLIGFLTSTFVMVTLYIIDHNFIDIPEFFIGWISCTGFFTGSDIYTILKNKPTKTIL